MTLTDRGETVVKWLMVVVTVALIVTLLFIDGRMSKAAYERCINRGNAGSVCDNILEP